MTDIPKFVLASDKYSLEQLFDWVAEMPSFYNRIEECVLIALIAEYPMALEYMRKPTKAVMMAAVQDDPCNIGRINSPPKDVQLLALSLDPHLINDKFIRKPCPEAIALAALIS